MTTFRPMACGFHEHTDEGSLDGASTVASKILYADKLGRIASCVTDHGTMNALSSHWIASKKAKTSKPIKSIHGIELYVIDEDRGDKVFKNGKSEHRYYHLTVHFKDMEAYQYFCKLTPLMESRALVKFGERKPLIYKKEIEAISGHITIGSGCLIGMVMKNLMPDDKYPLQQRMTWAANNYEWLRSVAGKGNFFVEVFPHEVKSNYVKPTYKDKVRTAEGFFAPILEKHHVCSAGCSGQPHFKDECGHSTIQIDIQNDANKFVIAMAKMYKDPMIISEDNHFASPDDKVVQDCVEKGTMIVTSEGVEKIENIKPGDFVLTHTGSFQKVLSTRGLSSNKPKTKLMFGSENGLTVTEDHLIYKPCVVAKDTKNINSRSTERIVESFEWHTASSMGVSDYLWFPSIKAHASVDIDLVTINMVPFLRENSGNLVDSSPMIHNLTVDDDFCYFLGLFLGDGFAGGKDASVVVNDWNTEGMGRVLRFFQTNAIPYRIEHKEKGKISTVFINQPQLKRFLYSSFYKNKQKYIPLNWFFSLSYAQQNNIIEGLYHADGRSKGQTLSILTVSVYLYGLMIHWALKNNLIFSNDIQRPKGKTKHTLRTQEVFGIRFTGSTKDQVIEKLRLTEKRLKNTYTKFGFVDQSGFTKQIKKIESVNSDLPVFDLEVEHDQSFVTVWGTVHNCRLGNGMERWRFSENYCMRDSNEWAANLRRQMDVSERDIEEMIDNSYKFVDLFGEYKMTTARDRILLPSIEMVYGVVSDTKVKLKQLIDKHGRMPRIDDPLYQVYLDRVNSETAVYADNGVADFLPYLFVIEDAAEFARANDILMNTRGSAGGSLLVYLLNISITDPIKYGLQFERMLTIGRIKSYSFPDIDTDWQDRGLIIQYILKKYGASAALISTNMMLRVKSAIKDIERFRLGNVLPETNNLLRMIKPSPSLSDLDWLYGYTDKTTGAAVPGYLDKDDVLAKQLKEYSDNASYIDENGKQQKIWPEVLKCLAITKTKGIHAGGVVITPKDVSEYMPMLSPTNGDGILATAYTMKYVEEVGGIKYDFLGVKTLASIGISMRALRDIKGVNIGWGEFPHDTDVYTKVIHEGLLSGLFQINTSTMRPFVLKIRPVDIQGLSNIISLVRPGCLEAPSPDPSDPPSVTAAMYYVMCAQGVKKPFFIHDDLKPILSDSYGVILTQEQTLRIFRDIGDYTYESAEEVRRGIGKKIKELLEKHGTILKAKCLSRGWTQQQADLLFESIQASARYSFNCAHSTSYAIVAYNGAYLKHTYPAYYWLGELTVRSDDHDKLREYLRECADLVLPVNVNKSKASEWSIECIDGKDMIRPPLSVIKSVGDKGATSLKLFMASMSPEEFFANGATDDDKDIETVKKGKDNDSEDME